ncbi:hypothetical protein [Congregibacter litoralis]|uniref:Uncharacterized protein n=1 Tax=Congregibacter litoralis KT71 TaxID=314285 RepID=A4A4K8_9GAMM|nr:hypothetical protein [Congregibacter litoralis]EAQ98729.1 hypothetical protein KT71_08887 [Congregibacter litoralis KT71]
MFHKILLVFVFTVMMLSPAGAQDIPPHGWTIRYSQNSLYLTRPDLPNIRVAVVSDIREELSQDEKFEHVKTFFAERANCPSLAKAETNKAMSGFSARSAGAVARCKLISMAHWVKGGLQTALILNEAVNEDKLLGGIPSRRSISANGYIANAIQQDIVQFFITRYQIAQSKMPIEQVKAQITAEGLASLYPHQHKPQNIVRLTADNGIDAISNALVTGAYALMLFPKRKQDAHATAVPCMQWDAKLFQPYKIESPWHEAQECERWFWKWKDGQKGKGIEIRTLSRSDPWVSRGFIVENIKKGRLSIGQLYKPFAKGQRLDLKIGGTRNTMHKIVDGGRALSTLAPYELILLPDGRFMAGTLRASSLPDGKTSGPAQGQYYFDGHAVTLLLDSGHVIYGFAGWLPYKDETNLTFRSIVNINGWIYTTYCRDGMKICE